MRDLSDLPGCAYRMNMATHLGFRRVRQVTPIVFGTLAHLLTFDLEIGIRGSRPDEN